MAGAATRLRRSGFLGVGPGPQLSIASVAFKLLLRPSAEPPLALVLRPRARATLCLLRPCARATLCFLAPRPSEAMDAFTAEQQLAARLEAPNEAARRQAEQPTPQAEGPPVCSLPASGWLMKHFCPMVPKSCLIDGKLPVSMAVSRSAGGMTVLHVIADYLRSASREIERVGPSAVKDFQIPLTAILRIPGLEDFVNTVPGEGHIADRAPYRRRPFFCTGSCARNPRQEVLWTLPPETCGIPIRGRFVDRCGGQ